MSNPVNPLYTVGPMGERWSFNPSNGRWALEHEGKRSSSANPETLVKKLEAWTAEGKATSPNKEEAPVVMESRDVMLMMLDLRGPDLNATPVAIRASWSPEKGRAQAQKVKRFPRKGGAPEKASGWSNMYERGGHLVDPFDPSESAYEMLMARVRASFLARKAYQAESTIAKAWVDHQSPASATLEWRRHERRAVIVPRQDPTVKDEASRATFSHHKVAVPQGVPLTSISKKGFEPSGWKEEQGAWVKGDVRVCVEAGQMRPSFSVQARGLPGQEGASHHTLFFDPEFEKVMRVAEATHELLSGQAEPVSLWKGMSNWQARQGTQEAGLSWPAAVDVMGVLAMDEMSTFAIRNEPVVLVLQKDTALTSYDLGSSRVPSWKWTSEHLSPYARLEEFWRRELPVPRDLVDAIRTELHGLLHPGAEKSGHSAPLRPSHPDDPRPLVSTNFQSREGSDSGNEMEEENAVAIQSAWGRLDEDPKAGTEDKGSMRDAMEDEWNRLIKGLVARVKADPEVVRATQKWERLAQDYAEALKPAPRVGGPKR